MEQYVRKAGHGPRPPRTGLVSRLSAGAGPSRPQVPSFARLRHKKLLRPGSGPVPCGYHHRPLPRSAVYLYLRLLPVDEYRLGLRLVPCSASARPLRQLLLVSGTQPPRSQLHRRRA